MGSNPAEDNQGYELFGEIAHKNQRFFFYVVFIAELPQTPDDDPIFR